MLPHRHPQWPLVIDRSSAFVAEVPSVGTSLAAFERQVLLDVDPSAVPAFVAALRRKKMIWLRRQGGVVRVFAERPDRIAGIFPVASLVDRFLASATVYMTRIAFDVVAREKAKADRDALAAQEARDRLDASGRRLVSLAIRHTASGMSLGDCRRTMWLVFSASAMDFLAGFEPTLAKDSVSTTIHVVAPVRRIESNLDLPSKVAALIFKAGDDGATKKSLGQGIRPRVSAADIDAVLADLVAHNKIGKRPVRIAGSGRPGVRYFATGAGLAT